MFNPEMKVVVFDVSDVITTSDCLTYNPNCQYDTGDRD